ncbi:uncharacterized protein EV420DRAFT_1488576 [Desarmillaria tabescens]|uniref:Uncharacterized protein n=1 Tax=Armillaria tabescens TaxID=1929756 RepID=A0AA39J201_ARMTA|nr:uncharacterized protein EV420DRAFT_1488576 [Desarmillaria tabescens]KAK0434665.1 hypothetical protein EV420DRAFT_1488576 [Desarmillaria tabescens]
MSWMRSWTMMEKDNALCLSVRGETPKNGWNVNTWGVLPAGNTKSNTGLHLVIGVTIAPLLLMSMLSDNQEILPRHQDVLILHVPPGNVVLTILRRPYSDPRATAKDYNANHIRHELESEKFAKLLALLTMQETLVVVVNVVEYMFLLCAGERIWRADSMSSTSSACLVLRREMVEPDETLSNADEFVMWGGQIDPKNSSWIAPSSKVKFNFHVGLEYMSIFEECLEASLPVKSPPAKKDKGKAKARAPKSTLEPI